MMQPLDKNNEKIPENYFKDLKLNIIEEVSELEQFEWSSYPILHGINKENDFSVPPEYFQELGKRNYAKPKKTIQLPRALMVAASLLLLVACLWTWNSNSNSEPNTILLADTELSTNEILEYYDLVDEGDLVGDISFWDDLSQDEMQTAYLDSEEILQYLNEEADIFDLEPLF